MYFKFDRAVLSFLRFLFHLGRVVHLHKNGFALRLVLKHRQKRTRKWPVGDINLRSVYFESPHFYFDDIFFPLRVRQSLVRVICVWLTIVTI